MDVQVHGDVPRRPGWPVKYFIKVRSISLFIFDRELCSIAVLQEHWSAIVPRGVASQKLRNLTISE
jgi:hypothetical protein